MRKIFSFSLLLTLLAVLPDRAVADYITPAEFGTSFAVFNQAPASDVLYAYDSLTDVFSYSGPLGTAAAPAVMFDWPLVGAFDVEDIVGSFSLTASVDGTGTTSGGSFSWIGESASLGIAAGSTLLAGTVERVEFFPGLEIFQIVASVDSVATEITDLFGPINSALIECTACPGGPAFGLDPWSASFDPLNPAAFNPSIFGSARVLPEPGTLILLSLGFLGLAFAMRRRRV